MSIIISKAQARKYRAGLTALVKSRGVSLLPSVCRLPPAAWLLLFAAAVCYCLLLAAAVCCWLLLAAAVCCWLLLAAAVCCWLLQAATSPC